MLLTVERFSMRVGGVDVVGVLHLPPSGPAPCVVVCHGMGASKDSDKSLLLGRDATIASRIADLEAVLAHLARHPFLDGRFGLLGSSLGGFVALCVASRHRRVMPVVTWNAPANLASLAASRCADVTSPGAALVAEIRAGRYVDTPAGAGHVLVVQGQADDVVPPGDAQILFERAREPRELRILPGADHRFSDPFHRLEAVKCSLDWFTRRLHPEPA